MSRSRNPLPSYLPHKQSGRARAVWTDLSGSRHERLLPGKFDSPESRTAFARLCLELEASPTAQHSKQEITIVEVLVAYLDHAERHYRGLDGTPTGEFATCKLAIRAIRELYGDIAACEFGPMKLKAARQKWISNGLSRSGCNRWVGVVKRVFKWAASEELVPISVHQSLTTVTGLQRGRTDARETKPVLPVEDAIVDATMPHLNRHVRGLIQFQRLTGCRPGEACGVTIADIDASGKIWLYRPKCHKTAWRGKPRVIAIGPKAQSVLQGFVTDNPADKLFSASRAVAEITADRAEKRKTPRWGNHKKLAAERRKKSPKRKPKDYYDRYAYARAVARACKLAGVPHWHPNQLRHTFATEVRKNHGLEAAQVLLGHDKADTTQLYAERNEALAVAVAAKIG